MRIIELIHRTARRARGGDFTQLSLTEKGDVMQAANAALQTVYNILPVYFKQMTVGLLLPAPQTASPICRANSAQLDNAAFTTAMIGRTVIIDGDPAWNQVVATDTLQNPYMGSAGAQTATVYGDAVYSDRYPFDRIIGAPRFADQTQLALISRTLMSANTPYAGNLSPSFGRPFLWDVQPFGNSQGNNPLLFLRFFPLPDIAYSICVDLAFWPQRLTMTEYESNAVLPVPDQFLDACLVPLAVRELMTTPVFETRGPANDRLLLDAATRAENFLALQPGQVGAPANRVLTPVGF